MTEAQKPTDEKYVRREKADLDLKIEKLDALLYRGEQEPLVGQERSRLISQLNAMKAYQQALQERILHNFS